MGPPFLSLICLSTALRSPDRSAFDDVGPEAREHRDAFSVVCGAIRPVNDNFPWLGLAAYIDIGARRVECFDALERARDVSHFLAESAPPDAGPLIVRVLDEPECQL